MIAGVDLLVVGGLSLDRFPDGAVRGGGAVLHAARALRLAGGSVGSIVSAGPEPAVQDALGELAARGPVRLHAGAASIRFAIDERRPRRRLVLEQRGDRLRITALEIAAFGAHAVLLAPIAGELGPSAVAATRGVPLRAAALQGWLRALRVGRAGRPLSLHRLSATLLGELAQLDALTASLEDLAGETDPAVALDALRRRLGPRPLLVVTNGAAGAWLDLAAGGRFHVPAPQVVEGVSTVGAGDAFAAILAVELGHGRHPQEAAHSAAEQVAKLLAGSAG